MCFSIYSPACSNINIFSMEIIQRNKGRNKLFIPNMQLAKQSCGGNDQVVIVEVLSDRMWLIFHSLIYIYIYCDFFLSCVSISIKKCSRFVCICVCMCECVSVCLYVCMSVYVYVCMQY